MTTQLSTLVPPLLDLQCVCFSTVTIGAGNDASGVTCPGETPKEGVMDERESLEDS